MTSGEGELVAQEGQRLWLLPVAAPPGWSECWLSGRRGVLPTASLQPLPEGEWAIADSEEEIAAVAGTDGQAAAAAQAAAVALEATDVTAAEVVAKAAAARAEGERLAAEAEARAEGERLAAEAEARAEGERLAAEAEARAEGELLAAEAEARAECLATDAAEATVAAAAEAANAAEPGVIAARAEAVTVQLAAMATEAETNLVTAAVAAAAEATVVTTVAVIAAASEEDIIGMVATTPSTGATTTAVEEHTAGKTVNDIIRSAVNSQEAAQPLHAKAEAIVTAATSELSMETASLASKVRIEPKHQLGGTLATTLHHCMPRVEKVDEKQLKRPRSAVTRPKARTVHDTLPHAKLRERPGAGHNDYLHSLDLLLASSPYYRQEPRPRWHSSTTDGGCVPSPRRRVRNLMRIYGRSEERSAARGGQQSSSPHRDWWHEGRPVSARPARRAAVAPKGWEANGVLPHLVRADRALIFARCAS